MPEEITETEPIQEEVVEKDVQVDSEVQDTEVQTELQEEKKEPESKETVISKIGTMIKSAKDYVSGGSDEEGADIPDKFTEVASKAGWKNEDIEKFASDYTNEELLEMIPSLTVEDSKELENPTKEKLDVDATKDSEAKGSKAKAEVKVEDSQDDEKTKKLLERIDALEKAQGLVDKETEQQKLSNLVHQASQIFDKTSKEFEVFGKTGELPIFPGGKIVSTSPQMKARNEVWDLAYTLYKSGMDFDNAMSASLNAYKGKNLTKDVKRSIIKDLKKSEKKLSGKHTSHESASVIEYGPDVVREVARRAGREIN